MDNLTVTPESLVDIVQKITEGFLKKRLQDGNKSYFKLDFKILEQNNFFIIQLTKCSLEYSNLKCLLSNAFKKELNSQKLCHNIIVAEIEKKSLNIIQAIKVYATNSSLSLIKYPIFETQKEFSSLKSYISIKILFQVKKIHLELFSSLLLCYILQLEKFYYNIKFLFRNNDHYIYRNYVKMDDIILSCIILNNSCTSIFKNSQDINFRKDLMNILDIRKSHIFEKNIGFLLLAQVNTNFNGPNIMSK